MNRKSITTLRLRSLRALTDTRKYKMADLLGISAATYNRKENKPELFTALEIDKILKYFNKTYEEIFLGVQNEIEEEEI